MLAAQLLSARNSARDHHDSVSSLALFVLLTRFVLPKLASFPFLAHRGATSAGHCATGRSASLRLLLRLLFSLAMPLLLLFFSPRDTWLTSYILSSALLSLVRTKRASRYGEAFTFPLYSTYCDISRQRFISLDSISYHPPRTTG